MADYKEKHKQLAQQYEAAQSNQTKKDCSACFTTFSVSQNQ